jgi:tRNA (cmo5U34)-methyltransferase
MIARSAPGYELMVPMIGLLARRYAQSGSNIYDLGCSLGATTLAIRTASKAEDLHIIAVDNSEAMVSQCRENLHPCDGPVPVELRLQDIRETEFSNASVVALNLTLQFIEPRDRLALLTRIARGMNPGGILVLSEKVRFEDARSQRDQADWHHDFKRAKGYSDLEIARKRSALENVLQADTEEQHFQRLQEAGFSRVERWFQCFSFQSFVAFR